MESPKVVRHELFRPDASVCAVEEKATAPSFVLVSLVMPPSAEAEHRTVVEEPSTTVVTAPVDLVIETADPLPSTAAEGLP